jgi:hypothetical protein
MQDAEAATRARGGPVAVRVADPRPVGLQRRDVLGDQRATLALERKIEAPCGVRRRESLVTHGGSVGG